MNSTKLANDLWVCHNPDTQGQGQNIIIMTLILKQGIQLLLCNNYFLMSKD